MYNRTNEELLLLDIAKAASENDSFKPSQELITKIDWQTFLKLSNDHKVFPLIYRKISNCVPDKFKANYEQKYYEYTSKVKLYTKELERICKIAATNDVDIVLDKGIAWGKIIYNNSYMRDFGDIDILVHKDNLKKMVSLVEDFGYFQTYDSDDNTEGYKIIPSGMLKYRMDYFEYQFIKNIGNQQVIILEVKNETSCLKQPYIEDFLNNIQSMKIATYSLNTFDLYHTFLDLCVNVLLLLPYNVQQ